MVDASKARASLTSLSASISLVENEEAGAMFSRRNDLSSAMIALRLVQYRSIGVWAIVVLRILDGGILVEVATCGHVTLAFLSSIPIFMCNVSSLSRP